MSIWLVGNDDGFAPPREVDRIECKCEGHFLNCNIAFLTYLVNLRIFDQPIMELE